MFSSAVAAAAFAAFQLYAANAPPLRFFPVVSGTAGNHTFRTTVDLRNTGAAADCRFEFRRANMPQALVAVEHVQAGETKVLQDFLHEFRVASMIGVTCPAHVEIHSRIDEAIDGGATYNKRRLFRAFAPNETAEGELHTIDTSADLIIAEISGKPAKITVTFTAAKTRGTTTRTYDLSPFHQQLIDVSSAVHTFGPLQVSLTVEGEGRVVAAMESKNPPPAEALVISPFKAAPFQDPVTGLVLMRDRWYDSRTGTFLTSDPEGYNDSSNPYAFCGGDPVNCSDPTGRLGDGGDLRHDFRMKEQAEAARRHAIWCKQHPVECKKLEVRGRGIARMVGGAGQTTAGAGALVSTGPLPEPLTKGLGGTAVIRGIDNTITGAVEMWTGTPRDTVTGRAFYLALVKSGISSKRASEITGWTEAGVDVVSTMGSSAVPALNTALRIRPAGGVINIGGTGEVANASNLNPIVQGTGGQTRNIPNHVRASGEAIAEVFEPNSARQVMSNRLPFNTVDWQRVARGAHTVLQSRGEVSMNIYVAGLSKAEEAAFRAHLIQEFTRAGFRNVRIQGQGSGTMLLATK